MKKKERRDTGIRRPRKLQNSQEAARQPSLFGFSGALLYILMLPLTVTFLGEKRLAKYINVPGGKNSIY
jgi:hypothetical protein